MTVVMHEMPNNPTQARKQSGSSCGWLGTCGGLVVLTVAGLLYLQVALPLLLASAVIRMLRPAER